MADSLLLPPARSAPPPEDLEAAFRDLHGRRLHGFALLATLGDRALAARLAAAALAAGAGRIHELRHPERAAAWLRHHVVRSLPRRLHTPDAGGRLALGELGLDSVALDGLAALDTRERAALVAALVERLDRRDVATIVGRDPAGLGRLLARARRSYLAAVAASRAGSSALDGPLTARVRTVAARAIR